MLPGTPGPLQPRVVRADSWSVRAREWCGLGQALSPVRGTRRLCKATGERLGCRVAECVEAGPCCPLSRV